MPSVVFVIPFYLVTLVLNTGNRKNKTEFISQRISAFKNIVQMSVGNKLHTSVKVCRVISLEKHILTIGMTGLLIERTNLKFVVKCWRPPCKCKTGHFTSLIRRKRLRNEKLMKKVCANFAKLLFFIAKYANLWRSCHRYTSSCLLSI